MDEASEAEEGRVRGGRQLSDETRINALVLLAWSANGTHLLCGAIANIARESLCSPGQSAKSGCDYLMAKRHPILLNPKRMAILMPNAMTQMILSKKFICYLLVIAVPYVILLIT